MPTEDTIINYKRRLNIPWLFEMAWRDSRKNRSRLFLFVSSIIFGIAALVAIYTFGVNLKKDVDSQAATLIGADLTISGNKPTPAYLKPMLDSLGDQRSQERTFASMIYFLKGNGTRLVQVRALQGDFPYYGSLETSPAEAGKNFRTGKNALVDQTLMLQFNAQVNDSIKVGKVTFLISGVLNKAPGQSGIMSGIAPIVYIPLQYLEQTGLSQKGSRIGYNFYYKYNKPVNISKLVKTIEPKLQKEDMNYDTIDTRKENTGRSFEDLTKFLSLVGFIALLLGCVGVASAIQIYIREKIASIAIMRCLGVKAHEAFLIYLIQIVVIGFIGSVIGAVLGTFVQHALPVIFKDVLPIAITTDISWISILQGILLGVIISVLFALLPLIGIRNISPLNTLRLSYDNISLMRDPLRWLVYALILLFVTLFSQLQLDDWTASIFFTIGIVIAFILLTFTARLLMYLVRAFVKSSWSYLWRQGFANLYRPNNQTIILLVSIGLNTAFICTLFIIPGILVKQVALSSGANQANMILFDIQTSQEKPVAELARSKNLPVLQQVPVITVRLEKVKNKTAAEVRKDTTLNIPPHIFSNEYRVTFRDSLTPTERIVDGGWIGKTVNINDVPVSVEAQFAKHNNLKVGDALVFNVQGTPISTHIASTRMINWSKMQTNFLFVFPKGVLEDAPQFHVLLTRVPSKQASATFQQAVIRQFPNVSIIDLGLVLSVLDQLLDKLGDIIKFMAAFSIITGVIVLIASVRISKYQRIQESVLLRTMGASRRQILAITAIEYLFLGVIAAATGILIAIAGSWLLAKYRFDVLYQVDTLSVVSLFFSIAILTILIGLFNSRGILDKPPLEILRNDV